jgi:hypothetical protein
MDLSEHMFIIFFSKGKNRISIWQQLASNDIISYFLFKNNIKNMSILNEVLKKIDLQKFVEDGASDVNLIQRRTKVLKTAAFNQIMLENSDYKNKDICKAMNISPSTMCRIRRDIGAKSPYRYDIPTPRRKKKDLDEQNPNMKETQKPESSKKITTPKKAGQPKQKTTVENIPAGADISSDGEIEELLKNSVSNYI